MYILICSVQLTIWDNWMLKYWKLFKAKGSIIGTQNYVKKYLVLYCSTKIVCFWCGIDNAKDPKYDDEGKKHERESKIKQKVYYFCYSFVFPCHFLCFHGYWNILAMHLQELENRVEHNNTEGVEHGNDHPDIYHLDVRSHG